MRFKCVLNKEFAEEVTAKVDLPAFVRMEVLVMVVGCFGIVGINIESYCTSGGDVSIAITLAVFSLIAIVELFVVTKFLYNKRKKDNVERMVNDIQKTFQSDSVEFPCELSDGHIITNNEIVNMDLKLRDIKYLFETPNYFVMFYDKVNCLSVLKSSVEGTTVAELRKILTNRRKYK